MLRKEKSLPESVVQTDSYIAVQLLENAGHLDFNSIREMAEDLIGSFVFTILDDSDGMYFVRGDNPLCIYKFHTHGFYLYASTRDILDKTLRKIGMSRAIKTEVKTNLGDILRIDSDGNIERSEFFAYNDISTLYSLPRKTPWDNYYINQLKEIASCFGVDPQYVDLLYENGFSADEIEELLYEPEELMNYADVLEYEGLYF